MEGQDRWEYHSIGLSFRTAKTMEEMNALGAQGWELVAITHTLHAFFKRRLPAEPSRDGFA